MAREYTTLDVAGLELKLSSPSKVYFPAHDGRPPITKLDLAEYYMRVADETVNQLRERPTVLKRWKDGITGEFFFQKRVPEKRPEWLQTATVSFPSGRSATELVPNDAAHLVWAVNLGNIDWNPWPVRRTDLDHPDELRIDLDPMPAVPWSQVREVALAVDELLGEMALRGYPKTSGSRGIHVNVRIEPRWSFLEVRRAALALAREIERRMPGKATSKWWKEERVGVFLDYNQNARDRTVASAYSVRPVPDARVSTPLRWEEVADVEQGDLRLDTVPDRVAKLGDPAADIDEHAGRLDGLLELARQDEEEGLGDAPWPPNFAKQPGEPKRVQPSRARKEE
ncbi:MAG TPA: DNA polymerase domain-containing protein [Solirubrobacteraceae bacterium]|jgi:DNA ligase D-like protein (predicted polymerase)|nr:DNA polymerase domain-containing protein [Solirubrobacteraceae bacterium]